MGHNIDKTYIQMRMLNTGKGPAVRALRAQADKHAYHRQMKLTMEREPNLTLRQATVDQLIVEDGVCKGVITNTGARYHSKTVVLTVGTAARGKIIIGELQYQSGPNNSKSAVKLSENLEQLGFDLERFKTGTPPRVNGNTINFDETEEQPGDVQPHHFSFDTPDSKYIAVSDQLACWLTYTNPTTHGIIRANLNRAPMFSGVIKGLGPATAHRLKTRSCVLPTSPATRSSWNQKVGIRMSITLTGFPLRCPKRSSKRLCTLSRGWRRPH